MPIDLDISDAAITVVEVGFALQVALFAFLRSSIPWKDQANIGGVGSQHSDLAMLFSIRTGNLNHPATVFGLNHGGLGFPRSVMLAFVYGCLHFGMPWSGEQLTSGFTFAAFHSGILPIFSQHIRMVR